MARAEVALTGVSQVGEALDEAPGVTQVEEAWEGVVPEEEEKRVQPAALPRRRSRRPDEEEQLTWKPAATGSRQQSVVGGPRWVDAVAK